MAPPASADWSDGVYLSTDATLDTTDQPLALVAVRNSTPLAAQASYTLATNVFLKGIAPGNYFLILKTDARSITRAKRTKPITPNLCPSPSPPPI